VSSEKDNYGIRALPHLETKFVSANALIGIEKPKQLAFEDPKIKALKKELKELYNKHFKVKTRSEKKEINKKAVEIRNKLKELLINDGWPNNTASKIANFDIFDQTATADWFDPEWMFGVEDGFDIVIGNPPYVKEYTNRSAFDGIRKSPYYQGKMDIWYMFVCKGIDLLKDKGILTFIAQNNWVTSYGASKMRNKVINDTRIIQLVDFGSYFIFESSDIQTMIMIFQKDKTTADYTFNLKRLKGKELNFKDVVDMLNGVNNAKVEFLTPLICRKNFINRKLTFSSPEIEKILNKIKDRANFYLEDKEITQGIVPNPDVITEKNIKKIPTEKVKNLNIKIGDSVFVVDKNFLTNLNYKEKQYLKEVYEPSMAHKYCLPSSTKKYLIYITKTNLKDSREIPNIISHLSKYKEIMEERRENKMGRIKFYHLHWPRDSYFFIKGPKILVVRKCSFPIFIYTEREAFVMLAFNVIKTNRINLKYLTGLLNSKLIAFWLRHRGKMQGNNYQIDKEPLLNLPLINPTDKEMVEQIGTLADKIIQLKQIYGCSADTSTFETQIDQLVYKLYDLTPEEIEVVEENVKN